MELVIAEKPSVAQSIAAVLGATQRKDGYLEGKKGSYDAYLIPESVQEFSYTKDGKEIKGFQYKFKMEFSQKTGKQG